MALGRQRTDGTGTAGQSRAKALRTGLRASPTRLHERQRKAEGGEGSEGNQSKGTEHWDVGE